MLNYLICMCKKWHISCYFNVKTLIGTRYWCGNNGEIHLTTLQKGDLAPENWIETVYLINLNGLMITNFISENFGSVIRCVTKHNFFFSNYYFRYRGTIIHSSLTIIIALITWQYNVWHNTPFIYLVTCSMQ